jgi:flagellar biosynthesis/type III secretory pathway chaperone
MGWDRGYYYRAHKLNGRVVREYIGAGLPGRLCSELDALERQRREEKREEERKQREDLDALDAPVDELSELVDRLASVTLEAAGFHRRKGQWRKRRVQ